jgi:predicted phosphodiesterase
MSKFSDRVEELLTTVESEALPVTVARDKDERPTWRAGATFDGREGEITTKPRTEPVGDWDDELRQWGFDPARFEVVEPIRFSTWQTYDERQLWAYKAVIRTKSAVSVDELELLCAPVQRDRRKATKRFAGSQAFVVPIGDWQIGKDDGDGLEGTVSRVQASFEAVLARAEHLRKAGYDIGHLVITSSGDIGEGCTGFYEQQTFSVELDRRDQNKVSRRLVRNMLMLLAPEFERVTVAVVGGNHGENRRKDKSFTSTNDNDDVAIFEAVAETLAINPEKYGHIEWLLPKGELSVSFKVGSQIVGLAHGHQAKSGDIGKWWQAQALAGRPVADADLLITGHLHHFVCKEVTKGRWHVQVPAMDGGSYWFAESSGGESTSGQVTFLLSDAGWTELAIL